MKRTHFLRGLAAGIAVTTVVFSITNSNKSTMTEEQILARARELGYRPASETDTADKIGQLKENVGLSATPVPTTTQKENSSGGQEAVPTEEVQPTREAEPDGKAEPTGEAEPTVVPTPTNRPTEAPTPTNRPTEAPTPTNRPTEAPTPTNRPTEAPTPTNRPTPTASVQLTITPQLPPKQPEEGTGRISVEKGMGSQTVSLLLEQAGIISSAEEFDRYLKENGLEDRIRIGTYRISIGADFKTIAETITR